MADENNSPSVPSAEASASNQKVTVVKPDRAKIVMPSTGGGFSFDDFNRATGVDVDKIDEPDEPEVEEGSGELLDSDEDQFGEKKSKKAKVDDEEEETDESEQEESEEDSEEEENQEDLEALSSETKKGIKAFTKDGKELKLPPDLEIEQVVDGEPVKINLREHLNVVAGELTVKSRLGKVSSFREEVEQRRKEIESEHSRFTGELQTLVSFAAQGKPELAICYLAELNGISPIQMKKQFLKSVLAEATRFEGKSEVEIENYYLNLENQWRNRKEKKASEQREQQEKANQFVQKVNNILVTQDITPEDFSIASEDLRNKGELEKLGRDDALSRVVEHALLIKHVSMAKSAIEAVDPKLVKNTKLFNTLLDLTHPNKFTVEEMSAVLKEYLGKASDRIASSLSKKVQPQQVRARSEKQNGAGNKKKVFKSADDLARAFGLS